MPARPLARCFSKLYQANPKDDANSANNIPAQVNAEQGIIVISKAPSPCHDIPSVFIKPSMHLDRTDMSNNLFS